jgi:hypothetical protein
MKPIMTAPGDYDDDGEIGGMMIFFIYLLIANLQSTP